MSSRLTLHIGARDLYFALAGRRLHDGTLLDVWFQGAWQRGLFSWCELSTGRPRLVGWGGPPHDIAPGDRCRRVADFWQQRPFQPAA